MNTLNWFESYLHGKSSINCEEIVVSLGLDVNVCHQSSVSCSVALYFAIELEAIERVMICAENHFIHSNEFRCYTSNLEQSFD
jgi:hypothetical protein